MKERVQKLMAQANVASRRAAEELIREGRVKVNGQIVTIGDKADPDTDTITVDGERLKFSAIKRYIAYNKPTNVLSAPASDRSDDRQTVREMIPLDGHLFTIGRLDAESDGLIVLTDDGEMANKLMHPRYEHTKTYKVTVYGVPSQQTLDQWEHGVFLEEGRTAPCSIRVQGQEGDATSLRIVMIEGKNRQIRRVAALMGHPVKKLTRTHIGQLALGTLRRGEWVELTPEDIEAMQTPASDLSYIKRLKREVRAMRGKGFAAASRREESSAENTRPSTFQPRSSRPGQAKREDTREDNRPRPAQRTRPGEGKRDDYARDDDRPRPARPGQRPAQRTRPGEGKRDDYARDDDRPRPARPGQRPAQHTRPGEDKRDDYARDDDRPRPARPGQRPAQRTRPGEGKRDDYARDDDRPRPSRPGQRPAQRTRPGEGKRDDYARDDDRPRPARPGQRPAQRTRPGEGNRDDYARDDDRPRPARPSRPSRPNSGGDSDDRERGSNRGKPTSSPRSGGSGTGSGSNRGKPGSSPRSGGGGTGSGSNRGKPGSSPRSGGSGSSGGGKPKSGGGGKGKPGSNRPSNRPAPKRRKP